MHRTRKKVGIFFGMAPVAPAMTLLGTGEKQQRRLTLTQLIRRRYSMKVLSLVNYVIIACTISLCPNQTMAWHDATHMAVAKAAGIDNYADMAKEKAGEIEAGNHYNNTPKGVEITPEMVLGQFSDYNKPGDADGHIYGAIVASVNDYLIKGSGSKYARYSLGYAAHYLGDLSMPFHNIAFNDFNKANHTANDGIVEITGTKDETTDAKVARLAGEIQKRMSKIPLPQLSTDINSFCKEIAIHISAIANKASALGYAMQEANPQRTSLTEEEVYSQLAQSAQLLKAVYMATMK
jgi:hypothetical protein